MSSPKKEPTATSSSKKLKRKFKADVDEESITPKDVKKQPPMPTYCKYNILKVLKENHCLIAGDEALSKIVARNKHYDLDDVKNFVNKTAMKSQLITEKNNKAREFKRATDLIKCIEERGPFKDQPLDIPLSLKTITDVFQYEDEEVDLRMLYQTVTNLSMGFPTTQLDTATNGFLCGVYKEFLAQVNSPQFQEDVQKYQQLFKKRKDVGNEQADVKHPTKDSDLDLVIKSTLNCASLNPLNVPYSLLHKPRHSF